jgi:hypothetical protein
MAVSIHAQRQGNTDPTYLHLQLSVGCTLLLVLAAQLDELGLACHMQQAHAHMRSVAEHTIVQAGGMAVNASNIIAG